MTSSPEINALVDAALFHVPFDGWSEASFQAALEETEIDPALANALLPRGAADLALAFHRRGDAALEAEMVEADLSGMRYRDKVAFAVRKRLDLVAEHKEAVRRGTSLFALPIYVADGSRALWQTADTIWRVLGDTSEDVNWYTKRLTLSGVYGSTGLYWLGDTSPGHSATWEFLDRRIENVMQIEKVKGQVRSNKLLRTAFSGPLWMMEKIKAPQPRTDMPGQWRR